MSNTDKIENLASALKDLIKDINDSGNTPGDVNHVEFKPGSRGIAGKGILWTGDGNAKQFVFANDPNKFFSSENIDLARDKHFSINNVKVLDEKELGTTITKSNLRELGRLKGLIVDGSMVINQYLHYNASSDRLGLGTDEPNAAVSICENGVEIILGTSEHNRARIGVFNGYDLEFVTDSTARITIGSGGNIELGNKNFGPSKVSVHGNLTVNVSHPDSRTDLHVAGAIKFNDNLHISAVEPPSGGNYTPGDITWNSNPQPGGHVGWICVRAGNPGEWCPFGEIKPIR